MLDLPRSTEVNRRVPKEKLYANARPSPKIRELIKEQLEAVIWRNKLAPGTFNISAGEKVKEIQVFELELRRRVLDRRVLSLISKAIPYEILFVLSFQSEYQAWIEIAGGIYGTPWMPQMELKLEFEELNLDSLHESLARQLAGGRLDHGRDLTEAVERDKKRQQLEREINTLQNKMRNEKQFNRQVEMNAEIKGLQEVLEGLSL